MIAVVMGVSGVGKTTIGKRLAAELGWTFYEGDDFHPAANVDKMSRGIPLTDEDRAPWLAALREVIDGCVRRGENAILACSALKSAYRETLRGDHPEVVFVHLRADPRVIAERLEHRTGHYMKRGLLESQLATLEEPGEAVAVDASGAPGEIVEEIRKRLGV
ncbi:MAG TPA: gluconokinase [Thermoanaerobaculia bacterium]|nr:gluconokinase [Thermoanaerobaculia bacterium]